MMIERDDGARIERGDGWELRWCGCMRSGRLALWSEAQADPTIVADLWGCLCSDHGLASLEQIDHVITDPPYGEHSHTKQRTVDKLGRHEIDALPFAPICDATMTAIAQHAARICDGWILAFCELEQLAGWRMVLELADCKWRRAGIWDRPPTPQISADRPGQACEGIAIAWCGAGRSRWNARGKPGIWRFANVWRAERRGRHDMHHPSEKPIDLMEALIADFTQPGDLVCDPFAGSGTTGVACIRLGRRFIGWERDPHFFETAIKRLANTREQRQLWDAKPQGKQVKLL